MRIEGYLWFDTPLWMWVDEVAERLVNVQEFWFSESYLTGTWNDEPHYGVIFDNWPRLRLEVARFPLKLWRRHA